jgi:trans-AT polyketide synthase, acyltransferase and oxidoreductase domains
MFEYTNTTFYWQSKTYTPAFSQNDILKILERIRESLYLVQDPTSGSFGLCLQGEITQNKDQNESSWPIIAILPPLYPEWLGDRSFGEVHRVRFPYVTGAMANGIATTQLVIAMAKSGCLGFFGAAGLSIQRVERAVKELNRELGNQYSWGCNLIHSPQEPALEEAIADLYIQNGVRRVSAAAYMALTPAVVRFALTGIKVDEKGHIHRSNHLFAKISRPEVARRFLEPAPKSILDKLVMAGQLTPSEAELGSRVPVAEDIIVESDSGGHTDNRPLSSLFPCILSIRDEIAQTYKYSRPIRVGAAGGIGCPAAAAAAFSLGAAFVLTGSVNQACLESGLHEEGKKMLAKADIADVIMAPAADMFEMGVEVQVLRSGTMFAVRGKNLYRLYNAYPSLEAIPELERSKVEKTIFKMSLKDVWENTKSFWMERDPKEVGKAEQDPKHKMALVFRSYLGQSSRWAIAGDLSRRLDYQIWCGPAMGAFNQWTKNTFLEKPESRSAVQVALNILEGAAVLSRAQQLRSYGAAIPSTGFDYRPRPLC